MRPLHRKQPIFFTSFLILFILACDATFSVGFPTATFTPPTETVTVTPPSLKLTFNTLPYNENNDDPPYTITAQIPQLAGSNDPRVLAFNQTIGALVQGDISSFKSGLTDLPNPPQIGVSTFDQRYTVIYQGGDVWSIKFDINVYVDGAAHPGDFTHTLNYDFAHSKAVSMADLFMTDSNYLEFISKYCSTELTTREIGFDPATIGAEPTPENYRNWNITTEGLLVTFERGQVAAYAAPAQVVTIPYGELTSIINPQGPLAVFMR